MMNQPHAESLRSSLLRRLAVYGTLFFLLAVLQCSFFARLSLFSAVPDLMIGALCGIALMDTREAAMSCGIGAGFLIDAIGSTGISLSPLLFLLLAILLSVLANKMLPTFFSWLVMLLCGALGGSLITCAEILVITRSLPLATLWRSVILPELLCTLTVSVLLYFPIRLCVRIVHAKSKFRM